MMCFFFSLWKRATPLIAMLFVSVAPDVKIISFGSAPIKSAICYGKHELNRGYRVRGMHVPFSRPRLLSQPPIHTHVSGYEGYRIDRSGKVALHRVPAGRLVLWPKVSSLSVQPGKMGVEYEPAYQGRWGGLCPSTYSLDEACQI